jgi:hypothetical protein
MLSFLHSNFSILLEDAPEEAHQYANKGASMDKRLEAAVAIIKKAYLEVTSYDSLLESTPP